MGNSLVFKNADFRSAAIPLDSVFDLVKKTDEPDTNYPLSSQLWYNSIPLQRKSAVYAISFTLPSDISTLSKDNKSEISVIASQETSILRKVTIDATDIVNNLIDGIIEKGTTLIIPLPAALIINKGENFAIQCGDTDSNRIMVYSRNPSGNYGFMSTGGSLTSYNLAVNLYGEFLD